MPRGCELKINLTVRPVSAHGFGVEKGQNIVALV